jgi:hypothetical protein
MISLASLVPSIAAVLGEKPTTLIERQRALVRAGILEALPGRGRGAGVIASPETVAMLLIGLMATVRLADAAALSREIADAIPATRNRKCPLTGGSTFLAAMTRLLSDVQLATKIARITVTDGSAGIELPGNKRSGFVVVIDGEPKATVMARSDTYSRLRVDISILGSTIRAIAALLARSNREDIKQ